MCMFPALYKYNTAWPLVILIPAKIMFAIAYFRVFFCGCFLLQNSPLDQIRSSSLFPFWKAYKTEL